MINAENERSIKVAERLGLSPLREHSLLGDPVVERAARNSPANTHC